ncbi:MAG: AAC(3) family N-acetyltransferase [Anaerolineales bacterium]
MPLPILTRAQLDEALHAIGVRPGDGLLVHSALHMLGQPEGGLEMVLDAMRELIDAEGNIVVPAFNFGFARGEDYDPYSTPSQGMGAFSEFVRQQPKVLRTTHPMQSVAVLGPRAVEFTGLDTCSAFDDGSVFERMLRLDFKLLLLGADIQAASIVHYSEQRANAPYRYWKDFTGRVKQSGKWHTRTYRMFVRDLALDPQLKLAPVQRALEARGLWQATDLNFGQLACCTLADFVTAADELLAADPWALVANKPEKVTR